VVGRGERGAGVPILEGTPWWEAMSGGEGGDARPNKEDEKCGRGDRAQNNVVLRNVEGGKEGSGSVYHGPSRLASGKMVLLYHLLLFGVCQHSGLIPLSLRPPRTSITPSLATLALIVWELFQVVAALFDFCFFLLSG